MGAVSPDFRSSQKDEGPPEGAVAPRGPGRSGDQRGPAQLCQEGGWMREEPRPWKGGGRGAD